ncbi:YLP motif-containing protein 1-like isoform X2 [Tigriopus californicus]|uniref:YLP motif-containing protein 1-like isoform X2 n=1 Tax=Tigriopus californicus TaxID=6832 RepID=UPI0027DA12F2|nr:YLP motif-containing protein 1-like isoform X2 [Tigriopus californicus]
MYPNQAHPAWAGSAWAAGPQATPARWPQPPINNAPPPMMMMFPGAQSGQAAWGRPPSLSYAEFPPPPGPGFLGNPWHGGQHWSPHAPIAHRDSAVPPPLPRPTGPAQAQAGRGPVPERDASHGPPLGRVFQDWVCPTCQHVNFQRRTHCLTCRRARHDTPPTERQNHQPDSTSSLDPPPPLPPPMTGLTTQPTPPPPQPPPVVDAALPRPVSEGLPPGPPPPTSAIASQGEYQSILSQEKQLDTMYESWTKNFEKWKRDHLDVMDQAPIQKQLLEMNALKDKMVLRRENLKRKRLDMFSPPTGSGPPKSHASIVKRSRWANDRPTDGVPQAESRSSQPLTTTEELSEQDRENIAKAIKALSRGNRPESPGLDAFQPKSQLQSHQFSWTKSKDSSSDVRHHDPSTRSCDNHGSWSDAHRKPQGYEGHDYDWDERDAGPSTFHSKYQGFEEPDRYYGSGQGPSYRGDEWSNPARHHPQEPRGPNRNCQPDHNLRQVPNLPQPVPKQQNRDPFVQRMISETITPVPATRNDLSRQPPEPHFDSRNRPRPSDREGSYERRNWDSRGNNSYWNPDRRVIDYNQRLTPNPIKAVDYGHGAKPALNPGGPTKVASPFQHEERAPPPSTVIKDSPAKQRTPVPQPQGSVVSLEDLIDPPGRYIRPPQIVIIFRGIPGSGKTQLVKDIKTKEANLGSDPPRILAIDEYFECDGVYEYEPELEPNFRQSLVKSFKKQIDDGYFSFIMVDCINDKTEHFEEMWSYAKQKGFEVYIGQVEADPGLCASRNIHNRSRREIDSLLKSWQPTPAHMNKVTLLGYFQDQEIDNVDMELEQEPSASSTSPQNNAGRGEQEEEEQDEETKSMESPFQLSKWEVSDKQEKMAQLDGVSSRDRKRIAEVDSIEDWLELDNFKQGSVGPRDTNGKKRVRWADIEEQRESIRMREVGFVVGSTNWNRMMNPGQTSSSALTKTKIIPNRFDI